MTRQDCFFYYMVLLLVKQTLTSYLKKPIVFHIQKQHVPYTCK